MAGTTWNYIKPRRAIGLPYHGLVTAGTLTLPNSDTISVLNTAGPSQVIKHPSAPGGQRDAFEQAHDLAQGKEWRDYALLSGNGNYLGNVSIRQNNNYGRIYIDGNGNCWLIEIDVGEFGVSMSMTLTVTLRKIFGRFGSTVYPAIDRQLTTATYDFTETDKYLPHVALFSSNETGSSHKINYYVHSINQGVEGGVNICQETYDAVQYNARMLRRIVTLTISGNGDTAVTTLGDGISASLSVETTSMITTDNSTTVTKSSFQSTEFFDQYGCPRGYEAISTNPIVGYPKYTYDIVIGEIYVNNAVQRITCQKIDNRYSYTNENLTGYYCCNGSANTLSTTGVVLQRYWYSENNYNIAPSNFDELSQSINLGGTPTWNCSEPSPGVGLTGIDPIPDPPVGSIWTAEISNGAIWFYDTAGNDTFVYALGVTTTTNLKLAPSDIAYCACNPKTNEITVSTSPVTYL